MRTRPRSSAPAWFVGLIMLTGACAGSDGSPSSTTAGTSRAAVEVVPPSTSVTGAATTSTESTIAPSTARLETRLDALGFAAAMSDAHRAITDPSTPSEVVERQGQQLQLLLRALADQPELDEAVLGALDAAARPSIERVVRARQFLQARSAANPNPSAPPTELPAWTIAEAEPIDTLLGHYAEAEQITGIGWYWLAAIHLQETRMGRILGVSTAGAVGPMQFLPSTWAECCTGDPTASRDAIIGAATYLAQSGGPADMHAAVYQYNPNDGYVAVVTAYAESLRDEPQLYGGFHAFQVFFGSAAGTVRLPIGYSQSTPIDAAVYLAAHPADAG
jgi:hypothetical protein